MKVKCQKPYMKGKCHYFPETDVTVLGQIVCKSLHTTLGMEIHYGCTPRYANPKRMLYDSQSCGK